MTLRDKLLEKAAEYCGKRGISEARLATIVVNDGKFFVRVRAGGEFTTTTYEKFEAYFAANPPDAEPERVAS